MILTGQNRGIRKKSVPLLRCPKQIPRFPNMKVHEYHFDKSLVDASLRTEGRAHRRNKAASYTVAQLVEALRYKTEKRLNVALWGFFNTAAVRPIVFLPPTSSRIHLQRRHAS